MSIIGDVGTSEKFEVQYLNNQDHPGSGIFCAHYFALFQAIISVFQNCKITVSLGMRTNSILQRIVDQQYYQLGSSKSRLG